jgi:hypothetical protein
VTRQFSNPNSWKYHRSHTLRHHLSVPAHLAALP